MVEIFEPLAKLIVEPDGDDPVSLSALTLFAARLSVAVALLLPPVSAIVRVVGLVGGLPAEGPVIAPLLFCVIWAAVSATEVPETAPLRLMLPDAVIEVVPEPSKLPVKVVPSIFTSPLLAVTVVLPPTVVGPSIVTLLPLRVAEPVMFVAAVIETLLLPLRVAEPVMFVAAVIDTLLPLKVVTPPKVVAALMLMLPPVRVAASVVVVRLLMVTPAPLLAVREPKLLAAPVVMVPVPLVVTFRF